MEKCFKAGKAKAIGVSNFSKAEMQRLLKETEVVPAAHQIELHPYLQQKEFYDWHTSHGIHVTQYSPFGNQNAIYSKGQNMGKLIDDPVLVEIGKKYKLTSPLKSFTGPPHTLSKSTSTFSFCCFFPLPLPAFAAATSIFPPPLPLTSPFNMFNVIYLVSGGAPGGRCLAGACLEPPWAGVSAFTAW